MAAEDVKWYFIVQYFEAIVTEAGSDFITTLNSFVQKNFPDLKPPPKISRSPSDRLPSSLGDFIHLVSGQIPANNYKGKVDYTHKEMLLSPAYTFGGRIVPTRQGVIAQGEEVKDVITSLFYQERDPEESDQDTDNEERIKGPFRWIAICVDENGRIIAFENGGNGGDK